MLSVRRAFLLAALAGAAIALSAAYVACYLRGGPRIIDATSYWLQARALSHGHVVWPAPEPTASLRGRFLLMSAGKLGVISPPGYPALLALGFVLGKPMWVGPALAGLLCVVTYALARRATGREDVARVAAALSVACAALRYHTADTMSHGWAAVLLAGALLFALDAIRSGRRASSALSGLCLGVLVATRPVTALAILPLFAVAGARVRFSARALAVGAALVPVALVLIEQRLVTGAFFTSSQAAYYAASDGPAGCFRLGFGRGIGCLHEHGAYVRARLPDGFGLVAAILTTLRRLQLHAIDVANAEPLALLVLLGVYFQRKSRAALFLGAAVALVVLGYVPFYFDGDYPGGGARFYADVLPVEHVLAAWAIFGLSERVRFLTAPRAAAIAFALCFAGFGLHAVFLHRSLAQREGGRPYYEPEVLAKAGISRGLVLTSSDHAYNLAFDPAASDPGRTIVVARFQGDDRDWLVWERLGRPPAYRYVFDGRSDTPAALLPFAPAPRAGPYRFEAEAEWPPLEQSGDFSSPCMRPGRAPPEGAS